MARRKSPIPPAQRRRNKRGVSKAIRSLVQSLRRRRRGHGNRYIVHSKARAEVVARAARARKPVPGLRRHVSVKGPIRGGCYSVTVLYTRRHRGGW